MNAQSKIVADASSPYVAIATALAQGDYSLLPEGDYTGYDDGQWRFTAQCCLDNHNDFPHETDNFDPLHELIASCIGDDHARDILAAEMAV